MVGALRQREGLPRDRQAFSRTFSRFRLVFSLRAYRYKFDWVRREKFRNNNNSKWPPPVRDRRPGRRKLRVDNNRYLLITNIIGGKTWRASCVAREYVFDRYKRRVQDRRIANDIENRFRHRRGTYTFYEFVQNKFCMKKKLKIYLYIIIN